MIETYLAVVLGGVGVMLAIALVNVLTFPTLQPETLPPPYPLVSVLIPARNEDHTIGTVLTSLRAQNYPAFEVIVLDDDSEDGTAAIVARHAREDRRIRLLRGAQLEEGWGGKAFACHQLSRAAAGELLLFVDADTIHAPSSISAGVGALSRSGADLVSVIPRQKMESLWERILLPLLPFNAFCYLPMFLIRRTRDPRLAMAIGQYMLFRRSAYESIGGHAAVRTALVEDVWLGRLAKERGFVLEVFDGASQVACRMYRSFGEIWNGFSKNLFAGFRYSFPMIVGVGVVNFAVSVVPPFAAVIVPWLTVDLPSWYFLILWQVLGLLMIRVILSARFRMEVWPALFHPVAVLVFAGLLVNSVRWVMGGGGARWKGRTYNFK